MILMWVGLEVANNYYRSTIPEIVEDQMRSLNPNLNTSMLQKLGTRLNISESDLEKTLENNPELKNTNESQAKTASMSSSLSIKQKTEASDAGNLD